MDLADVRIKEHFGLVTNDTNTSQFCFLVSPPKNRETIEKHDIVCFNHPKYGENCQVLAEVKEITSYEEVAGSTIGERAGKMLATAKIIGYFELQKESRPLRRLLAPPNPGSRVHMPYASFLEDTLNRGIDGEAYAQPVYLGKTEIVGASREANDLQVSCFLDAADLTRDNTLICAIDGAGKTHLAKTIIEEVARKVSRPIIVLDPNNEYSKLNANSSLERDHSFSFQSAPPNTNAKNASDAIMKRIQSGQVTVLTAENLSLNEKSAYYTNVLNLLAEGKRGNMVKPLLLVIEDAENLPQGAIEELLGSKIATILITSHPSALGGKILSKMSNQIVGRTIDPQDLAFLKNVTEGSEELLSSLRVGEWVINGLNVVRPLKIHAAESSSNQTNSQEVK